MATARTYAREIERLRKLCLSFPEATEKLSHGEPTWFCKKVFCSLSNDHHGDGYRPPYVGPSGWIGVRLDVDPDWDEIAAIVTEAYRLIAPKRLVQQLDE
jgi:hypothetical protein